MRYGQLVNTRYGVGFLTTLRYADGGAGVRYPQGFKYLPPSEAARMEPITAHCIDGFFTFASSPAIDTVGHHGHR